MPPADRARDAHGRAAALAGMSCPVCGAALEPRGPGGRDRLLGVPGRFAILVCAGCGLGVTSPDLSETQLEAHYPERYAAYAPPRGAPAWLIGRLRRRQMDQRLRREPYASIVAARRGRVLDVGCGRGDFAAAFVRRGWHAAGLDISPLAVQQACEVGVEAFAGTLDSAPWEPGSFDLVVMFHCLEHMRDPVERSSAPSACCGQAGIWSSRSRTSDPGRVAASGAAGTRSTCRATSPTSRRRPCFAPRLGRDSPTRASRG